ncbi:J domain-containing protein [Drosera capensis]
MRIPAAGESLPRVSSAADDVDFSDVFGGPPRRTSHHDIHHLRSSFNSNNPRSTTTSITIDDDEPELYYDVDDDRGVVGEENRWRKGTSGGSGGSGGGKAVFGDEVTSRRRYRMSEDFFDDVFGGGQSGSVASSPRTAGLRDPFAGSPGGYRVLSPAWPSRADSSGGGGGFSQFSLPARLAHADLLAPASAKSSPHRTRDGVAEYAYHSSTPMSRFSGQSIQNNDLLQGDVFSVSHRSPLSHESSFGPREAGYFKDYGIEAEHDLYHDAKKSYSVDDSTQFHFSIHKWAGKGVPLVMFLRRRRRSGSKLNDKNMIWRSSSPTASVGDEPLAGEVDTLDNTLYSDKIGGLSAASIEKQEMKEDAFIANGNTGEILDTRGIVSKEIPAVVQPMTLAGLLSVHIEAPQDMASNSLEKEEQEEEVVSTYESNKSAREEVERRVLDGAVHTAMSDRPSACSVEPDIADEKGSIASYTVVEVQGEEGFEEKKDVKTIDFIGASSNEKRENFGLQQELKASGIDEGKNRVPGRVKDFVKIFNQDSGPKPKITAKDNNRSSRPRERSVLKVEHVSPSKQTSASETRKPSMKQQSDVRNASETHKPSMKQQTDAKSANKAPEVSSTRHDYSTQTTEPIPEVFEDSVLDIDMEEILMLPEEVEKPSVVSKDQEENEVTESKIIKWSKGKEGNIRALLSTLQYVLWPNSGWKTVALVDIIEANAVKRAYQKAMLCLHPDKLQQRGADAQRKLAAEKLLDILQAAWDHFSTQSI